MVDLIVCVLGVDCWIDVMFGGWIILVCGGGVWFLVCWLLLMELLYCVWWIGCMFMDWIVV